MNVPHNSHGLQAEPWRPAWVEDARKLDGHFLLLFAMVAAPVANCCCYLHCFLPQTFASAAIYNDCGLRDSFLLLFTMVAASGASEGGPPFSPSARQSYTSRTHQKPSVRAQGPELNLALGICACSFCYARAMRTLCAPGGIFAPGGTGMHALRDTLIAHLPPPDEWMFC